MPRRRGAAGRRTKVPGGGCAEFDKLRHVLRQDPEGATQLIRKVLYLRKKHPRREGIGEVLGYDRRHRRRMDCAGAAERHLPIASSVGGRLLDARHAAPEALRYALAPSERSGSPDAARSGVAQALRAGLASTLRDLHYRGRTPGQRRRASAQAGRLSDQFQSCTQTYRSLRTFVSGYPPNANLNLRRVVWETARRARARVWRSGARQALCHSPRRSPRASRAARPPGGSARPGGDTVLPRAPMRQYAFGWLKARNKVIRMIFRSSQSDQFSM